MIFKKKHNVEETDRHHSRVKKFNYQLSLSSETKFNLHPEFISNLAIRPLISIFARKRGNPRMTCLDSARTTKIIRILTGHTRYKYCCSPPASTHLSPYFNLTMRSAPVLLLCLLGTMAIPSLSDDIVLEDFSAPKLSWTTLNDPVMGGLSTGDFRIDGESGLGIYDGQVHVVPRLGRPGFIKLDSSSPSFPDISTCRAIQLVVRSSTSNYQGFHIGFGTEHDPVTQMQYIRGHRAHFFLNEDAKEDTFQTIEVPFLDFSLDWEPLTGEAVVPCSVDKQFCPDLQTLVNIKKLAIISEGVEGSVHLEIKSFSAVRCGGEPLGYYKEQHGDPEDQTPAPYQSPEESAKESASSKKSPSLSFLFLLAVAVCGALYWKREQIKARGHAYYQAVETKEISPEEAGYSLELSEG